MQHKELFQRQRHAFLFMVVSSFSWTNDSVTILNGKVSM
jgi:hypothetical protein